ncbi:hypothetical protein [Aeromonas sanarellii]|uniref:hypothetical protein n=1 Tax=Aeromonas sanarellii TaxID=633415 RepID=UPI0038D1E4EB
MSQDSINQLKSEINALNSEVKQSAVNALENTDALHSSAYDDSLLLSLVVVGFGVFILFCITYLIRNDKKPDTLLRPFGTILIVIGAIFLIVAGYSEKQIAPVIGLLGTIAGYILGKDSRGNSETKTDPKPTQSDSSGGNHG